MEDLSWLSSNESFLSILFANISSNVNLVVEWNRRHMDHSRAITSEQNGVNSRSISCYSDLSHVIHWYSRHLCHVDDIIEFHHLYGDAHPVGFEIHHWKSLLFHDCFHHLFAIFSSLFHQVDFSFTNSLPTCFHLVINSRRHFSFNVKIVRCIP